MHEPFFESETGRRVNARLKKMSSGALTIVLTVTLVLGLHACANVAATPDGGSSGSASASADCSGTNGNSAVAACHPDNEYVQAACPDNSDGEQYAAPSRECLDAVP